MSRRAILQIGTEKTGTTTLQHFLATNRAELARRGYLYPRFCGAFNHTGLAAYALAAARRDAIRTAFGAIDPAEVPAMRERLRRAAAVELAGNETAIFCSEHCHSRLRTPDEMATLKRLLTEFFDDIQICVYLRRQDQVALSLYSTRLKSGGTDPAILPRTNAEDPYFNYDRSLRLWEDAFGLANVHARLFDRRTLIGGSVVNDFLAAWGLGPPEGYTPVADQNESIEPVAQEFLRLINNHLDPVPGVPIDEMRGPLAARLARLHPGRGARPARAEVEEFYAKFRPSNEAVRRRHFPELATLFDDDFSAYPDVADERGLTLDDAMALAARLHGEAVWETRRLEAEIAIRDARLHWAKEQPAEAEQALRRALRWCPDHPETHRALAEHMLRQDRLEESAVAATRAVELRGTAHEYWHFLGVVLRRAGDLDGAVAAQRRALEIMPGHAAASREVDQLAAARASIPRPSDRTDACQRPLSA